MRARMIIHAATLLGAALLLTGLVAPARAEGECAECHEEKTTGAVVHPAVSDFGCESCHEGDADEHEFRLVEDDTTALCLMCHDDPAEGVKVPHDALELVGCTGCHDPHVSEAPHLLIDRTPTLCGECHDDQGLAVELPHPHAPLTEDGCAVCHTPHGGDQPRLLRAPVNDLCLACHRPAGGAGPSPEAVFGDHELAEGLLDEAPAVALSEEGRDHPVLKHPVSGETNPRRDDRAFNCASCHEPHGSSYSKLLIASSSWVLCAQCHRR